VLRADLSPDVQSLPDSMSQLTNLEELNVRSSALESLFPGVGECKALRQLQVETAMPFILPPSLTKLRHLAHVDLDSGLGPSSPPGISDVTSLRSLELGCCDLVELGRGKQPPRAVPCTADVRRTPLR